MKKLLMISFDAVPSSEWQRLSAYPNVKNFEKTACVTLDVQSVFLSNTYPVHCSVVTGRLPFQHGVISNTEPFPRKHPRWVTNASAIKARTLWQAAKEAGLSVASFLWPCTGHSPHIRWNVPELPPVPGQNQILANLAAGSKFLQADLMLRYGKLLDGTEQPALDHFVTACAADTLRRKQPDLVLVHLTGYDLFCHKAGRDSPKLDLALAALDENLGRLLEAAGADYTTIIFSDHSQVTVHTVLTPNELLVEMGFLEKAEAGYTAGRYGCFIECCGGSAFFHAGILPEAEITRVREKLAVSEGFGRFLRPEEMKECGRPDLAFGYGLAAGYMTDNVKSVYQGNHGYPLDMPDYRVFYAVKGDDFTPGETRYGGSLLDIAPLAAKILKMKWQEEEK